MSYRKLLITLFFVALSGAADAQHSGVMENHELRKVALSMSEDDPLVIYVYDFCNRYFTELLKKSKSEREEMLKNDDVKIVRGSLEAVPTINGRTSMVFETVDNEYSVTFLNGKKTIIQISFPLSCQLLTGKNLKELELEFIHAVSDMKVPQSVVGKKNTLHPLNLKKEGLKPIRDNYYVSKGKCYYIEQINNFTYYEEQKGKFIPLFSREHLEESVSNLFQLVDIQKGRSMDLTIRKYGFAKENVQVPLDAFMKYVKEQKCQVYLGIEKIDSKYVHATVFIVNSILKYNHVMNVHIPYGVFDGQKSHIESDINLFIPMNNISSLFYEQELQKQHTSKNIKIK